MREIQKSAKTLEDAINSGLIELGLEREDVEVEIIEKGNKGFLGVFGNKEAIVKLIEKFNPEKMAVSFLNGLFEKMDMDVIINTSIKENNNLYIDLVGENMGILIGKRGQTLDSLEYLTSLAINKGENSYIRVHLDTEDYRKRRKETLENLAMGIAKKVRNTRKKVYLEPMTPSERRIIHTTLQNNRYVKTHSEGDEPFRKVVVTLQRNYH